MAYQPFMLHFIVCRNFEFFHEVQNTVQDLFVNFHTKRAVCILDNAVCSSGIESSDHSAVFICSDRELRLIPVAERLHSFSVHADSRMHDLIQKFTRNFSDPLQIAAYLRFFKCKLCLIFHLLNLAATTSSCHRTRWLFYTIFRRRNNIHKSCITVVLLCLHNLGFNHITDNRIFYK